jgi:hypothetical protein
MVETKSRENKREPLSKNGITHASDFMRMNVKDREGRSLGKMSDLVFDREGRIAFAILTYGGFLGIGRKKAAVPFNALRFSPEEKVLVINKVKEEFEWAYAYKKGTLRELGTAADIYRFYGVQPYWEESREGVEPGAPSGKTHLGTPGKHDIPG